MSSEEKAVKNDDRVEAQCIECGEWSRIETTGPYIVPVPCFEPGSEQVAVVNGPWWWTDESGDPDKGPAGCPKCGAVQFPESECEHRVVPGRAA